MVHRSGLPHCTSDEEVKQVIFARGRVEVESL